MMDRLVKSLGGDRRALVLGDANPDLVMHIAGPGKDQSGHVQSPPEVYGGGSAANTAAALARLAVPTAFIGAVGDDLFGRWTRRDLAAEGVDVQWLFTSPSEPTPVVVAVVLPDGERQVAAWPYQGGAQSTLTVDQIEASWFENAAWLHTSGICLRTGPAQQAVLHAMRLARQAGVPISLDLNLRVEYWGLEAEFRRVVMQAVFLSDVVLGSAEEEIIPLAGVQDLEKALRELTGNERTIVARLGAAGALAIYQSEMLPSPALPAVVIDTLGAGDAFNAGFIAARLAGNDLAQALRWGNAAAAYKIGRPGARGGPNLAELQNKLREIR